MIARVRSLVFDIVFYGGSVPIVVGAPMAAMFGARALRWWVLMWVGWHALCARTLVGMRTRLEGAPSRQPVLYAIKHQSFYETFEVVRLLDCPAIIMRQEYARVPFWGWAAQRYGVIVIDRSGSAQALRQMMRSARAARDAGRSVVIFPEGTRTAPGTSPPLKAGLAGLYRALALPVVPVAVDSGRLWPRHGLKRAGIVRFVFADPVPAGLPREAMEAAVHERINALER